MQRASWRLSKIPRSSSRVIPFHTREHRRAKGEKPVTLAMLPTKRASRKETVHLSEMTSAVPTCSPKDLRSKGESLSRSLLGEPRFPTNPDEFGSDVSGLRPLRREEPFPGVGWTATGGIFIIPGSAASSEHNSVGNNVRKDVSRLKNSDRVGSREFNPQEK